MASSCTRHLLPTFWPCLKYACTTVARARLRHRHFRRHSQRDEHVDEDHKAMMNRAADTPPTSFTGIGPAPHSSVLRLWPTPAAVPYEAVTRSG
jgi:hypothetical protein